jgi:1-deoxy-D-xylulose-5-phosphate reductoisomerase
LKRICILGSTGSIGRQTLDVVRAHPDQYKVVGLSAYQNVELLRHQIEEFGPVAVAVACEAPATSDLPGKDGELSVLTGSNGLVELVELSDGDIVVNGLVGSIGLNSTIAAIRSGKVLALANKESMVVGGDLVRQELRKSEATIIPVDSEHSAIFQCVVGEDPKELKKIILTGSGGPFRGKKMRDMQNVTVEEALAHPRWKMGNKISIDSATLMNKGLEVIEAHFLFGVGYDRIEIVIHPQSIIHSMVEFIDGSIKAHLGQTDMRIPIQYALSFPHRLDLALSDIDFAQLGSLTFENPDPENFPCLRYAFEAGRKGKTYPAVLNAANEEAVSAFLDRRIGFTSIPRVIEEVLDRHTPTDVDSLGDLITAENWAREEAKKLIERDSRNR